MDGFRYNGRHCEDLYCHFVPNETDQWFSSPDFKVYENTDTGRDGGYFYGTKANVRVFELRCYYEDITIAQREAIRRWLDRSTSGKLIFDERPFVSYDVRPTKVVPGKRYTVEDSETGDELFSGTFTITFSAYSPYGVLDKKDLAGIMDEEGIGGYCGIIRHSMMPAAPTLLSRNFLLYNCGTQTCGTVFQIGGTSNSGLTIANGTNGTNCVLTGLPATGYLEIDSRYGSVKWIHGGGEDLDFSYHTEGFITLDSYIACEEEITVAYWSGSTTISRLSSKALGVNEKFDERFVGKYVYIDGAWRKITAVAANGKATIDSAPSSTGITPTKLVTMNEITITGENIMLTTFEVDYSPLIV